MVSGHQVNNICKCIVPLPTTGEEIPDARCDKRYIIQYTYIQCDIHTYMKCKHSTILEQIFLLPLHTRQHDDQDNDVNRF
jgi:hypothetical protein